MPARWASVTSAQSVTPGTALTMASRTSGVRAQTSVSATLRVNSSLSVSPWLSCAVTFTTSVPASATAGVPVNVRSLGMKSNQAGSAAPSPCVAV